MKFIIAIFCLLPFLTVAQNPVQYEQFFLNASQRTELEKFTCDFHYEKSMARYIQQYGQVSVSYPIFDHDGETFYIVFRPTECDEECYTIEVLPIIPQ